MRPRPNARCCFLAIALLCGASGSAASQPYGEGFFVSGETGVATVTAAGSVTTAQLGLQVVLSATMAADNRTVLAYDSSAGAIFRVDPQSLAVVGTLYRNRTWFSPLQVSDLTVDGRGDVVIANRVDHAIMRIDAGGVLTTIYREAAAGQPFFTPRNIHYDVETADLLVADGQASINSPLLRLEPDGSSFTTVASGFTYRYGIARDVSTGAIYSGSCCNALNARSIEVLDAGQGTPRVFLASTALPGGYSVTVDRASAASPRLLVSAWETSSSEGLWAVDIGTATPQKLATLNIGDAYRTVAIGSRNLQWHEAGVNRWDFALEVTDGALAGKPYAVALSVTGTRPGLPLADGRQIPLAVDGVTLASVTGQLAGLFSGAVGLLSGGGSAAARLDLTPIGGRSLSFRVWAQAVVLDAAAPLGFALITDPAVHELQLR